ncbi:exosortase H [Allochromatium palmeri]|uniref:Exosortase H n=1 Tax=Allochromatium palmeri TaxID=231048 RepID=A0A6N8EFU5_9GAMM|nr:exosortase H [Allochromatium palmeri]MTW23093.1 exosortase H [Allochromatium palmeri]
MKHFLLVFPLLVIAVFTLELLPWGQTWLVQPWTAFIADISAGAMRLFDDRVLAQGKLIWDQPSGFGVAIEAGCNGIEAAIILMAAMLAFPATWRQRLIGITLGLTTVQGLNILRIISLFYLGQWNRTVFEWAHLYVWQALIMLDVLLVFLFWLRWVSRQTNGESPALETSS